MKKILICLVAILAVSCENYTTKHWGGTMAIGKSSDINCYKYQLGIN